MEELVVLVDEDNNIIGTAPKSTVHTTETPLHRAFSVFLFNTKKQFYITQRSSKKKTFAGYWTNSFCGHPGPGETEEEAAKRRAKEELGIHDIELLTKIPYTYRFADKNGIVEHEICPVFIAVTNEQPILNPEEVDNALWIDWTEFLQDLLKNPNKYSPWSHEEARLVDEKLNLLSKVNEYI